MFTSLLDGGDDVVEVFDDDGDKVVSMPIAESHDGNRVVSVDCRFGLGCDDVGDFWEFSFEITVISWNDDYLPVSTMDRDIAANYIPANVRPRVMEIVCRSLRALIEHVQPERIYRVTKVRLPPAKAMPKHHLLTDLLVSCGYTVTRSGTDRWGRSFWLCERL
jgi:hypothetical protein